ncbi:MAG: class I mannose-6-phosphate isomerase [Bryobacteraceae bacterium]
MTSPTDGPVSAEALRLTPSFREKVWGTTALAPWFPRSENRIGEVWFLSPAGPLPILVKFIFTSERLSVQVHPDDEYARRQEGSPGKTEMWYVLRAEPGASIAVGLREAVTRDRLRQLALSGEIERFLNWIPVAPGDTILTPARTIHAIGAGLALCEIQQQSDVNYRLYDYGRPRELHRELRLDRALDVASLAPHPGKTAPVTLAGGVRRLASCEYFVTDELELAGPLEYRPDPERFHILVVLEGAGQIGAARFRAGEAWMIPSGAAPFSLRPEPICHLLRTYVP